MSGYDRMLGRSPPDYPPAGPSSSRLAPSTAHHQQQQFHSGSGSTRDSMASVAAWREQQASSPAGGSTEDEDRLDDNASSEGAGLKRSYDSQDMRGSDEPRRKRLVTTPHQVAVLSEELRRNPFPNAERRDELAKELGMEPRRVQVWFQNRRQAERLARGRPPYNMMYNPWYPPPYGYPGYPAGMPPPGMGMPPLGPYPPTMLTGDPSLDILIPYGPRRPSMVPPSLQGDALMRGGLPPSHALSGSLASREAANHVAASTYRPGGEFGELGDAGGGSASELQRDAYGRPSTLAQDLAAMGGDLGNGLSNDRERHNERRTQDPLGRSSKRFGTSPPNHQPFLSSSSHSPELSLPMPSSFNRASGLPSLNSGVNDPFKLPLPKASSRSRGSTAEQNGLGNPFDPNRTLAPPRSSEIGTTSSSSRGVGRLPSLSQALEMHPELSPDPTSFRYPADFERSLFGGNDDRKGAAGGSVASGSPRLRRRSSLSRMNDLTALSRSPLAGPKLGGGLLSGTSSLASLGPLQSSTSGHSVFRAPAPRTTPRSGEFAAPLTPSFSRSLRRMPSDVSMTTTARRQSLRDSEMGRDNFPPSTQYGL